jgi:hypothetical protein
VYDVLKWIVQIVLPAIATLYFALAQIWGLPKAEEVIGSIASITIFLGAILGISTAAYNRSDNKYDGQIIISQTDEKKLYNLELSGDPEDLDTKQSVLFKIQSNV